MAITTGNDWIAAAKQQVMIRKAAAFTTVAQVPFSMFDVAGNPGAGSLNIGNTANGLVPDDSVAGFPAINAFGSGNMGYLSQAAWRSSVAGGCDLYERLFHAGSYSLTALGTTTLSAQPSFLSRLPDASYNGLEIFLEINAAVSATATTVAVTYTGADGTTGRTTGASVSLSSMTSRRVVPMPLQAGDKGVQKIESVVVGGTVATTGSVNVIIARSLASFDVRLPNASDIQSWDVLGAPRLLDPAAMWPMILSDGTSSGTFTLRTTILNG